MFSDNLRELYAAANSKSTVTANLQGDRLYCEAYGYGWAWKKIHYSYGLLNPELKERKLREAMEKTVELFNVRCAEIEPLLESYRKNLAEFFEGKKIKTWEYCDELILWQQESHPFLKRLFIKPEETLVKLVEGYSFEKGRPLYLSKKERAFLTWYEAGFKNFPEKILQKLASGSSLKYDENKTLQEWIKKIENLPVRAVHAALRTAAKDPVEIEAALLMKGSKCFEKNDPEHLKWRSQFKKGMLLDGHLLGEQLPKGKGRDNLIYFRIAGNTDRLLVIGQNQAILPLKKKFFEEHSYAIQPVAVELRKNYALVERLVLLKNIAWKSEEEAKELLDPVCKSLKSCIKQIFTPLRLDARYIGFNRTGCLRVTKMAGMQDWIDYYVYERLAFEITKKSPSLFVHVKKEIGLDKLEKERKFYEEAALRAIDGAPVKYDVLRDTLLIACPNAVEHARGLCTQIDKLDPEEKKALASRITDPQHPVSGALFLTP